MREWLIARHCLRIRCVTRCQRRRYASAPERSSSITPTLLERARLMQAEHQSLSQQLASGYDASLSKRMGELIRTVTALQQWTEAQASLKELQELINDSKADQELRDIAHEEVHTANASLDTAAADLKGSLVPIHPFSHMSCMLELRPGAGGSEAGIFANDLLRMYQSWCKRKGLQPIVLQADRDNTAGDDSLQSAVVEIEGEGAYGMMRCEAGVHRVQRVPATESKGRTHTSAVSVLILPKFPTNVSDELGQASFEDPASDYYINPTDVKTDVMRARGAGGQHVNTTDSAVRLTHVPTNTVVTCQEQRSQQKNRLQAWSILRGRIAQARREAREEEMAQLRLSVAGVGKMGRGDKIRTYNWSQNRVTDHRSGRTISNLEDCMEGGGSLDDIMNSATAWLGEQDLIVALADDEVKSKKS